MKSPLAWFVLASLGLINAARADEPAAAEVKLLEGKWHVVALEREGRKAPAEVLKQMKGGWTFEGDKVSFDDPNAPGKSEFRLDPSKMPREIDLIGLDGANKGKKIEGIYRMVDGQLSVCIRDAGSAARGRPKSFSTDGEAGLGLIVLAR